MVTTASVSGSRSTSNLLLYHSQIAILNCVIPLDAEYRWFFGFREASQSLSITCFGAGRSGLPIPRSMMSSPLLLASYFRLLTMAKT